MLDLDFLNNVLIEDTLVNNDLAINDFNIKTMYLRTIFDNERKKDGYRFKKFKIVEANQLTRLSGERLVKEVYNELLDRKPSEKEIIDNLRLIKKKRLTSCEYIELIACSEEATNNNVLLRLNNCSLDYFLRYPDELFLQALYLVFFDRLPDGDGYDFYLQALKFSKISRVEIIYQLFNSAEAREKDRNLKIKGLTASYRKKYIKNRLKTVPFLGTVIRLLSNLRYLNHRLHNLENYCLQLEKQLKENQNASEQFEVISISKDRFFQRKIEEIEKRMIREDDYAIIDYEDFENHFRGSREFIKKAQEIYVQFFIGKKNVLDLGCGRGEFTELLTDNNIGVTGIDQYEPYVQYMLENGMHAQLGDILSFLEKCENDIDGVFVGQVVEHMKMGDIIRMCELLFEKMEKESYIVIETPNPTSLSIYTNSFFVDPTHNKPVHPATLKYILEKIGFKVTDIIYTESSKIPVVIPKIEEGNELYNPFNEATQKVSELLFGSQDYAIIAQK